jgi:hypothetical protein
MSLVTHAYGSSGGGDTIAIVERESDRARVERAWQQSMGRCFGTGSAGVVVLVRDYGLYMPHVGTSPTVFDSRGVTRSSPTPAPQASAEGTRTTTRQAVLRMSSADQALEVLAAMSLNKTLLAEVLGVSRPTLYDWLGGKEPNVANAQRLTTLVQLLANAGVTAATSLSPRFVRQPLNDGDPSLLDLLKEDTLDEQRVGKLLKEAKALEDVAENKRVAREARLAALGFEEPSHEQRKANLALNVALREWPKD